MSKAIVCPECQSNNFDVAQFTWNLQKLSVKSNGKFDWGISYHHDYENEYPVQVRCAECEHDCTELFYGEMDVFTDNFQVRHFPKCACPKPEVAHLPDCPLLLADYADERSA